MDHMKYLLSILQRTIKLREEDIEFSLLRSTKIFPQKLYNMLEFANAAASIITTKKGALKVMSGKNDVTNFIQDRKSKI